jgi:antitoxin (DNA-binding transcriptional repressor) of toxin-antitoxin stability system
MADTVGALEAGEQVTITKHVGAVARVIPITDSPMNRHRSAFWGRVDSRGVALIAGTTIKAGIETGQAITS